MWRRAVQAALICGIVFVIRYEHHGHIRISSDHHPVAESCGASWSVRKPVTVINPSEKVEADFLALHSFYFSCCHIPIYWDMRPVDRAKLSENPGSRQWRHIFSGERKIIRQLAFYEIKANSVSQICGGQLPDIMHGGIKPKLRSLGGIPPSVIFAGTVGSPTWDDLDPSPLSQDGSICHGFCDSRLSFASFPEPLCGKPQGKGEKGHNDARQGDDRALVGVSRMDATGESEANLKARTLDEEEFFFAKGLIGLVILALAYAILKRF